MNQIADVRSRMAKPVKLAHFVVRTSRYKDVVDFYKLVFRADASFENDVLSFLTFDEEHHRIAVLHVPGLADQPEGIAGIHHIAFTYDKLTDLLENFERLKSVGIEPVFTINHGPTTSLYYEDPDRNQLEFQVENYPTVEESAKFFFSEAFAENPIGVEFDPEDVLRRLRAGEPDEDLLRRPDVGKRGLADVKLR